MVFNVDFCGAELLPDGKKIGQAGEINATEMRIKLTDEMLTGADFHIVAFSTESGVYCTDRIVEGSSGAAYRVEDELVINVWQQVSNNRYCAIQILAYAVQGDTVELLRKTKVIDGLWFAESVGAATVGRDDMPDLASKLVAQLHDNFTTLAKFGESDGALTYDGLPVGGSAGTTDYAELENKPTINGVELSGDKSSADLLMINYITPESTAAEIMAVIDRCVVNDEVTVPIYLYIHIFGIFIPLIGFVHNLETDEFVFGFYSAVDHEEICVRLIDGEVTLENQRTYYLKSVNNVRADNDDDGEISLTPADINAATSAQGEKADSAIQTVKVNGTPLVPDANKAVDVITVNYITQDMTAAEILEVAARCADENGTLKEPMYFNDQASLGLVPCTSLSYDSTSATIYFYYAADYWTIEVQVYSGEVTIEKWQNNPTPQNIGAAAVNHTHPQGDITGLINALGYKAPLDHDHAGVYQPVEEGKGLSTNDLTNTLKTNYDTAYTHSQAIHAPTDAQENVIETVKVNGNALTVTNKAVDIVEPQWRTIKTLTLTEELNEIVITSDSDNAAFSLVGYIVKLEIPTAAVTGNAAVRASTSAEMESAVLYSSFQQGVNSSGARYMACRGELRGGLWSVNTQYPTTQADSGANVQTSMVSIGSEVTGVNTVSRFRISSSASTAFPVGTVITVLGVDANA